MTDLIFLFAFVVEQCGSVRYFCFSIFSLSGCWFSFKSIRNYSKVIVVRCLKTSAATSRDCQQQTVAAAAPVIAATTLTTNLFHMHKNICVFFQRSTWIWRQNKNRKFYPFSDAYTFTFAFFNVSPMLMSTYMCLFYDVYTDVCNKIFKKQK